MVAVYRELEVAIPIEEADEDAIANYMLTHLDLLKDDKDLYFGGWVDRETGMVYLDISRNVIGEDAARALGRKYGQLKIWDVKRGAEIDIMTHAERSAWEKKQGKSYGRTRKRSGIRRKALPSRNDWFRRGPRSLPDGCQTSRRTDVPRTIRGVLRAYEKETSSSFRSAVAGNRSGSPKSDCGANKPGGGGFIHGNTCAAGHGAGGSSFDSDLWADSLEELSAEINPNYLGWTRDDGYLELVQDEVVQAVANEQMESNGPPDSATLESYDTFKTHLGEQFEALIKSGLVVKAWKGEGEPYKESEDKPWSPSSKRMREEVARTGEFMFFMTEKGFGSGDTKPDWDHPLLEMSPYKTADGEQMVWNDVFRVVHDAVAHIYGGFSFSTRGEMNGSLTHALTMPEKAWPALFAETFAQNAVYEITGKFADQNAYTSKHANPFYRKLKEMTENTSKSKSQSQPKDSDHPIGAGRARRAAEAILGRRVGRGDKMPSKPNGGDE